MAWTHVLDGFSVENNTFPDGLAERVRLVVLLEPTVLPRVVHVLVSIALLGEQTFENLVSTMGVNKLLPDRINSC